MIAYSNPFLVARRAKVPAPPLFPTVSRYEESSVRVAVVTLSLTAPVDPAKVGHRELEFSPAAIGSPNPIFVAADAATVADLKFPIGPVTGTLTDVSPRGIRSGSAMFSIDATPPDVTPDTPAAPAVASVAAGEVPDPPAEAAADPIAAPSDAAAAPTAPEAAAAAPPVA